MEDRRLLTTYMVMNTNDSGPGSLRQAILNVNNDTSLDTIAFNIPGTGVQTISAGKLGTPFANITPPRFWGVELGVHF